MNKQLLKKLAKAQRTSDLNTAAIEEARIEEILYTPWPLSPWILKTIKRRFDEFGVRTRFNMLPRKDYEVKF